MRTIESMDAQAVAASIRDIEQGERDEPLDEFLASIDAKHSTDNFKPSIRE